MVFGLKQSIPFVVQGIPEVTFNEPLLPEKISHSINTLKEIRPSVRCIVTNNHSVTVNAFSALIKVFISELNYFFP